ncbi:MAG: hypothetical protein M3Z16_00805 [Pseudomonadota bacterium]|nr:hypothetical protein [Pseudomonadota bacterium]
MRARIAGESRLAFKVPDGFDVAYTLEGLLAAIEELEPTVPANAPRPGPQLSPILFADLFTADVKKLGIAQRGAGELRCARRSHRGASGRRADLVLAPGVGQPH